MTEYKIGDMVIVDNKFDCKIKDIVQGDFEVEYKNYLPTRFIKKKIMKLNKVQFIVKEPNKKPKVVHAKELKKDIFLLTLDCKTIETVTIKEFEKRNIIMLKDKDANEVDKQWNFDIYNGGVDITNVIGSVAFVGSMILLGIVAIMVIVGLIYVLFKLSLDFYHQTKLPLKKEEMEKLNITNPDEYLEFVRNYLPIIVPSENIQNRIIFTSYLYLYDEDTDEEKEDILHNAFKFSKVPVCVDNYEYIYDFSNEVTVCNDKNFKKLVSKLFSKNAYEETFFEEIY